MFMVNLLYPTNHSNFTSTSIALRLVQVPLKIIFGGWDQIGHFLLSDWLT